MWRTWVALLATVTLSFDQTIVATAARKERQGAVMGRLTTPSMFSTPLQPSRTTLTPILTESACGGIQWVDTSRYAQWWQAKTSKPVSYGPVLLDHTQICLSAGAEGLVTMYTYAKPQ